MLRRLLRWFRGRKTPVRLPKGIYVPGNSYGEFIGTFTFLEPIQINDGEECSFSYEVSRDNDSQKLSFGNSVLRFRDREVPGRWTPSPGSEPRRGSGDVQDLERRPAGDSQDGLGG